MPVTRRRYTDLQARYELSLEQRDRARSSLETSRSLVNQKATENDELRERLTAKDRRTENSAELARARRTIKALDEQLRVLEASNLELSRQAMSAAGTAVKAASA